MDFNLLNFIDVIEANIREKGDKENTFKKLKPDTPIYHGTEAKTRFKIHDEGFKPSKYGWLGKGVYTSPERSHARMFGPVMRGQLLPGTKVVQFPDAVDPQTIFKEKPKFSMSPYANIHMDAHNNEGDAFADYDNDLSKNRRYRNVDAIRWKIKGEDNLMFLDPRLANATFDTIGGPKAGPKSSYMPIDSPRKFLSNKQLLNTIITGIGMSPDKGSGLGNLIKAFVGGQAGAKFVETGLKRYNEEKAKRDKLRVPTQYYAP